MKALRYLLMAIAILGVLSVKAQTHQYGSTHTTSHEQAAYSEVHVNPQMPTATMGYPHSDYMTSGSNLPQSAVTGTSTTYGEGGGPRKVGLRKVGEDEGTEDEEDPDNPGEPFPIGDAAWPLMLLACAYLIFRVVRKRTRAQATR